jgi:hypothetical protein
MTKALALQDGNSKRMKTCQRITAAQKRKFIAALTKVPSVKHAAIAAGFSRRTAYDLRRNDEEFNQDWLAAISASVDEVETRAFELALKGEDQVAANLITFLLRCHKPEVYRERIEAAVAGGVIILPAKAQGSE